MGGLSKEAPNRVTLCAVRMVMIDWSDVAGRSDGPQRLATQAETPGVLVLRFSDGGDAPPHEARFLERFRSSRAVTVADLGGAVSGGALELVLSCDLLYCRPGALLDGGPASDVPPFAAVNASRHAGLPALRRLLLDPSPIGAEEAVSLGLAADLLQNGDPLPIPADGSLAALTTARDLMRAGGGESGRLALEHAAFRLLFAAGAPQEGGRAFLERRDPDFEPHGG